MLPARDHEVYGGKMTLYTKILLFFISLIILLSIVTTYSGIRSIEHIAVNELDKGLNSDINLFSFAVDREFYHIESRMELFSMRNVLKTAVSQRDKGRIRELLADRLRAENIDMIQLSDEKMRPIVTLTKGGAYDPIQFPAMDTDAVSRGLMSISSGNQHFAAMYVSIPFKVEKAVLTEFFILDNSNSLVKNLSDLLSQKREEPVYVSIFKNDTRMFSTIFSVTGEETQKAPGKCHERRFTGKKGTISGKHPSAGHSIIRSISLHLIIRTDLTNGPTASP